MNQFGLNFGNPANFADWSKYAGFNPNSSITGMDSSAASAQPVVPPTMAQVTDTFSKVGDQLGSGNFAGAYQSYVGKSPVAPTTPQTSTPQVQPVPKVTGFGHDFEG
jgi:hypothetical protein